MAAGVEFDEDKFSYAPARPVARPGGYGIPNATFSRNVGMNAGSTEPGIAGWLIRHGFANSPRAAQGIMIGVVILNVIITFIVIKFLL